MGKGSKNLATVLYTKETTLMVNPKVVVAINGKMENFTKVNG